MTVEGSELIQGIASVESGKCAICTVISKNYLAQARTLWASIKRHHPDMKLYVLLVDTWQDTPNDFVFDPQTEGFEVVPVKELDNIPNQPEFFFKYDILELNTAVKPYFFEHLISRHQLNKLIYFDPDIYLFAPLDPLLDRLDEYSILLTPHLLQPIDDNLRLGELDILRAGTFNLGFLGMTAVPETLAMLRWWQSRLYDHCLNDPDNGYFVDQKWMNLAPGLVKAYIAREATWNVAYWNFNSRGRGLRLSGDTAYLDDSPVVFFHFSGFDPDKPEILSKYQDRYTFADLPGLRPIFDLYIDAVVKNGYRTTKNWPYAFGCFDNGVPITPTARAQYRNEKDRHTLGDPFATEAPGSFYKQLQSKGMIGPNAAYAGPPSLSRQATGYAKRQLKGAVRTALRRHPAALDGLRNARTRWLDPASRSQLPPTSVTGRRNSGTSKLIDSAGFGVNVAGPFQGEYGGAEAARAYVRALQSAKIATVLNNITSEEYQNLDDSFERFADDNPYPVNLIALNADCTIRLRQAKGPGYFRDRYNIANWFWELSEFPQQWWPAFEGLDEIWVASSFCADSIGKIAPIPVLKMPLPISIDRDRVVPDRKKFGIPDNATAFVFAFDFRSFMERKNPLAVIAAFRQAFGESRDAVLVLKCISSHLNPEKAQQVRQAAMGLNMIWIDEHLRREEVYNLFAACDCLVSLHRSEGLGLSLAEAMLLGKPVIATGYSGNMEFMDVNNSFLVKHKLVTLEQDYGPYSRGNVWAEPDIDHAAQLMMQVHENPARARAIGQRACRDIEAKMSLIVSAQAMKARFARLPL